MSDTDNKKPFKKFINVIRGVVVISIALLLKIAIEQYNKNTHKNFKHKSSHMHEKNESKEAKCIREKKYLQWNENKKQFECIDKNKNLLE